MAITPEKIQQLADPIEEVYIYMVDELMTNIGRHITSPTWTHTAAWEVQKLSEMGQLSQESAKIINKWIKDMPATIRATMEDTRAAALDKLEKQMEQAAKDGYVTPPVSDSVVYILQDYAEQAADKLNLVNTTMLQSTLDQYARAVMLTEAEVQRAERTQKILNEAAGNVATGVETRRVAMRRAIGRIAEEGLTGFIDRAGHHWTPEAYVNMDIRTTVHNVAIQSTKAFMGDYDVYVFQVSSHAAARPLCYPYQGKFYSWDNSSGEVTLGDGKRVSYEPLNSTSYGQAAGLFGINCGHYPIPIIPGVTIPHGADNIQDEEDNKKAYEESQEQRAIERKIRAAKRVVEMAGDTATEKDKQRVKDAQAEMREFIERTGRTRRYDREQIGGTPTGKSPGPDERLRWGTTPPTTPTAPTAPTATQSSEPSEILKQIQAPENITAPAFVPAETISDAEEYARKFTGNSSYTKIDYTKIDLQYANDINRAIDDVLNAYAPKYQLREIVPMNKREKRFKGTTADAAYQWGSNKLYYNADYFKNQKAFDKHVKQYRDLLASVLPNVDQYLEDHKDDKGLAARKMNDYLQGLKNSGRTNVSEAELYKTIVHEMGHYLDDTVFRSEMKTRGFNINDSYSNYSRRISAYATESREEYVAESFLAYWIGERNNLDPDLVSIFEGTKK